MTGQPVRHLVLEMFDIFPHAVIACTPGKVLFDREQHTILTALATCPACLAVQAARVVLIDAESEVGR